MNLPEFLEEYGIQSAPEDHEHYREGWANIDCPDCSPDWQHYRLGVNLAFGYASCWNCGPKSLLRILCELSGVDSRVIEKTLELDVPHSEPSDFRSGKYEPPSFLRPLSKIHFRYLRGRGFDPESLVRLWDLWSVGPGNVWSWRIFIPILRRGLVVSWSTRAGHDESHEKRYRSSPPEREKLNHKTLLYGEDYCRHACIVTEGFTDVWRVGPGGVATMGTSYTVEQVRKISRFPVRAICFDNEVEAQNRARELCSLLKPFPGKTFRVELDAADPGSAPLGEIRKLRKAFLE
jgi:hypothetical protein